MSRLGAPRLLDSDGMPLFSLMDINRLPQREKERIYGRILPLMIFELCGIDRETFCGADGKRKVRFVCPDGLGLLRIEARQNPGDEDCLFFVEVADTPYGQIELSLCLINDMRSPRFDVDRDASGRDNLFGTLRRNIPEEIRAMERGLSPNQVRKGLNMFALFFERFENFVDSLGVDLIIAEPLSYCNAVRYERYGFDYITGKQLMLWIDREFREGGELHARLDGSTPFRMPGSHKMVRGRSWAIHDGILGRHWDEVKIYKAPGVDAGIDTFPDRDVFKINK